MKAAQRPTIVIGLDEGKKDSTPQREIVMLLKVPVGYRAENCQPPRRASACQFTGFLLFLLVMLPRRPAGILLDANEQPFFPVIYICTLFC